MIEIRVMLTSNKVKTARPKLVVQLIPNWPPIPTHGSSCTIRRLVESFFPVLERTIYSSCYGNSESHQDDCRLRRNEPRTVQVPPQMGDWWNGDEEGEAVLGFRQYELNLFNTVLVQNMLLVTSILNFWVRRRRRGLQLIPHFVILPTTGYVRSRWIKLQA